MDGALFAIVEVCCGYQFVSWDCNQLDYSDTDASRNSFEMASSQRSDEVHPSNRFFVYFDLLMLLLLLKFVLLYLNPLTTCHRAYLITGLVASIFNTSFSAFLKVYLQKLLYIAVFLKSSVN